MFLFILPLLPLLFHHSAKAQVSEEEFNALKAFYDSTGGDGWDDRTGWDFDETTPNDVTSAWHGITVSDGRLRILDLRQNNLQGTIPPEIGDLEYLEILALNSQEGQQENANNLSGELPDVFENFTSLIFIDLSRNNFEDTIPGTILGLPNLRTLFLSRNNFSGEIPPITGLDNLERFNVSGNNLTGPIPDEIFNLAALRQLNLGHNNFTGPIPNEIGDLVNLTELSLENNDLVGEIPEQIGDLGELTVLDLSRNALTGEIPPEFEALNKLEELNLAFNELESDEFPAFIYELTSLEKLYLTSNRLAGEIDDEINQLDNLERLFLANNEFVFVPALNLPVLKRLYLQNNRLHFNSIEHNWDLQPQLDDFIYSPQARVGVEEDYHNIVYGEPVELMVNVGGEHNIYRWLLNGDPVPGADSDTYTIESFSREMAGVYVCIITNLQVTDLTLLSDPIEVEYAGSIEPTVETTPPDPGDITAVSAFSGGRVTDDGGADITVRGVVWSTFAGPDIIDHEGITTDGEGTGPFTSHLTALEPATQYHVRAYATNADGFTGYGEEHIFTTMPESRIPNAFRPDSQIPENRTFKPADLNMASLQSYSLEIYDRWGNKIFESAHVDDGWPGNVNGNDAPAGGYIYRIGYIDLLGNRHDFEGVVMLVR